MTEKRTTTDQRKSFIPDLNENIKDTFNKKNWQFIEYFDDNVNNYDLIKELHKIRTDIIVFAGYGGQLLRSGHFKKSKISTYASR